MDTKTLKALQKWVIAPASLAAGIALLILIDRRIIMPYEKANAWRDGCRSLFGKTWFFDIALCLGVMGLIALALFIVSFLLFRRLRKKGGPFLPFSVVTLLCAFALPCWRYDWVVRHKNMFLSWVPGAMLAVEILMFTALAVLFVAARLIRLRNGTPAERAARIKRIASFIRVLILVFRFAVTVAATVLIHASVAGAFAGRPAAIAVLAVLALLCVCSIWDDRKKQKAAEAAEPGVPEKGGPGI